MVDKVRRVVLRLVAEHKLSPNDADEILGALGGSEPTYVLPAIQPTPMLPWTTPMYPPGTVYVGDPPPGTVPYIGDAPPFGGGLVSCKEPPGGWHVS